MVSALPTSENPDVGHPWVESGSELTVEIGEALQQFVLLREGAVEVGIIVTGTAFAGHAVGSPSEFAKALVDAAALGDVLLGGI
jgi:hypothetical protein